MANVLSAIGRAQPTRNVLQVIRGGVMLDRNRRRNELTAADLAMSAEQLEQTKRKGEYEQRVMQEGETPMAIETLSTQFEGGEDGPMFKMVYDMAEKAGFVDRTAGGLGTIKKRQLPEVYQMMANPGFASKLSRTRIDYWRSKMGEAKSVLSEKPEDKNALAAFQQASVGLNQAVAQDSALMEFEKQQVAQQKVENDALKIRNKAAMDVQKHKLDVDKLAEEKRHNLASEGAGDGSGKTKSERETNDLLRALPELKERAAQDPMAVYRDGVKMNDDGTVWVDPIRKAPKILPEFTDALGKRGGPTQLRAAGEQLDDANELMELLRDPEVANDLKSAGADSTLWDRTKGSFANRIDAWMTKSGIAENSKTATTLRRMQMMASSVRKEFLGSAVTGTELKTITGWLLDPGDSYDAMINKGSLIGQEAGQEFKDFLGLYRNVANMSDWYDTYGIERFERNASDMSDEEIMEALKGAN